MLGSFVCSLTRLLVLAVVRLLSFLLLVPSCLVHSFVLSPVCSFSRSYVRCPLSCSFVRARFVHRFHSWVCLFDRLFSHPFARSYGRAFVVSSLTRSFGLSASFHYLVRSFDRLFSHPFASSYGRALVVSSFVRPFVLGSFSHSLVPLFRSFFSSFVCSFDFSLVILFVISFFRPFLLSFFPFEPSYKEIVKISVNGWSGIPSEETNCELHTSEKGL